MLRNPGHKILLGCLVLAALFGLFTLFPCSDDPATSSIRTGVREGNPAPGIPAPEDLDRAWGEDPTFDQEALDTSGADEDTPKPPRRNINRLFMVLRSENGMGPPPGAIAR